jgi:hypothetical protein
MKHLSRHRGEEESSHVLIRWTAGDRARLQRTVSAIEDQFGTLRLPSMNRVDFDINTTIREKPRSTAIRFNMAGTFPFKCRFEGINVIEGLRNLCLHEILIPPLPSYLTNLSSNATNRCVITDLLLEEEEKENNGDRDTLSHHQERQHYERRD